MDKASKKKVWAYLMPLSFNVPIGRITKNTFTVGRKVTCDLVLCQPYISHIHITIYKRSQGRGPEYTFVNHSKNKIYLNNTQITDSKNRPLKHNDEIWLVHKSMVPNCRQIGFVFQTDYLDQKQTLLKKFQAKINQLQVFAKSVRLALNCCKCGGVMSAPICLQPCCHKVCELCAVGMIENVNDNCPMEQCNKKVLALLEDTTFSKVTSAYHKYEVGEEKTFQSTCFAEPFIMQKWVKHHNKSEPKQISETNQKNTEKQSRKNESISSASKLQKQHQSANTLKKNTSVFKSGISLQLPQINFMDSSPKKVHQPSIITHTQQITNEEIQEFLKEINEINQQITEDQQPSYLEANKVTELDSQRLDIKSSQPPPTQNKVPAGTAECRHCKKKFPFTLKNIEQKQCQICRHPFCNKQFPPCKGGEQPLRTLAQRLRMLTKQNILAMIQQKQKKVINSKLLSSIKQPNELAYLFKYVLMRSNGCFTYIFRLNENQMRRREIKIVNCVCEECWPPLGRKMLLAFLRYQESKLKAFSHRNIEEIITQVSK